MFSYLVLRVFKEGNSAMATAKKNSAQSTREEEERLKISQSTIIPYLEKLEKVYKLAVWILHSQKQKSM